MNLRARLPPLIVAVALLALGCGGDGGAAEATVAIKYSNFTPERITVEVGEPVTITLRNDDPIEHEWIVGPPDVHERHRTGSEPFHDERPTEVTIPALSSRTTTLSFDEPGEYAFICHLPGHEAYGMVGTIHVREPGTFEGASAAYRLALRYAEHGV